MIDPNEHQKKIYDALHPAIENLVRKATKADLCITGFIFGGNEEGPILMQIGNITDKGAELIELHYRLALEAVLLQSTGQYSGRIIESAPEGHSPEEIADKLALTLLASPDPMDPKTKSLLQNYLQARHPEKK